MKFDALKNDMILSFLNKFFFILKAASEGWRIAYIGGNKFKFYNSISKSISTNTHQSLDFIKKYYNSLIYNTFHRSN